MSENTPYPAPQPVFSFKRKIIRITAGLILAFSTLVFSWQVISATQNQLAHALEGELTETTTSLPTLYNVAVSATEVVIPENLALTHLHLSSSLFVAGKEIINQNGQIPALTATHFANLDGSAISNVNALQLSGLEVNSFVRSDTNSTMSGALTLAAIPGSSHVGGGGLYVNPSSADNSYTLLGAAVNGESKFKVTASGTVLASDRVGATKFCIGNDETNCTSDFKNVWQKALGYIFPNEAGTTLGNSAAGGSNKLSSMYFGDTSVLMFGDDNDAYLSFVSDQLQINHGTKNVKFGNNSLFINASNNFVGIGTNNPAAEIDVSSGSLAATNLKLRDTTGTLRTLFQPYDNNEIQFVNGVTRLDGVYMGTPTKNLGFASQGGYSVVLQGANQSNKTGIVFSPIGNIGYTGTSHVAAVQGNFISSGNTGLVNWLTINPTINLTGAKGNYRALNINVAETSTTVETNYLVWAGVKDTAKFMVTNQGQVGINTAGAPTAQLQVNGNVKLDLSGAATTHAVCHSGSSTSTDDVELVDCSEALTTSYSEMYPVAASVSQGDLVKIGSINVTTKEGSIITQLVLADTPNDAQVVGVVVPQVSDFSTTGYTINTQDNPKPVALAGRVAVKVSSSSASINPGDYLTSSSEAGKASKASSGDYVIGKALNSWTTGSGQSTVMLLVEPGLGHTAQVNSEETKSGSITIPADTVEIDVTTNWSSKPTAVVVTPNFKTQAWVSEIYDHGFKVVIDPGVSEAKTVYWVAQ